jgi:hypothetical protein
MHPREGLRRYDGFPYSTWPDENDHIVSGLCECCADIDQIMCKVLHHQILEYLSEPFIDDRAVKPRSRSTYPQPGSCEPQESCLPGVRRFILEAIQNLDGGLVDIE